MYRELKVGEEIQDSDKYYDDFYNTWMEVWMAGSLPDTYSTEIGFKIRRYDGSN